MELNDEVFRPVRGGDEHPQLDLKMLPDHSKPPEGVGSYFIAVYRVVGYYHDSTGALQAEVVRVDKHGEDVEPIYNPVKLNPSQHLHVRHPTYLWPR